jgi:hypothetical protein
MVFTFRRGVVMFHTLPNGQVINKNQIVKIDENSAGDLRILMTGGVTVTIKSMSIDTLLERLGE